MALDTQCNQQGLHMPQDGLQLLPRNQGKLNGNHYPVHSHGVYSKSLLVRIIYVVIKCTLGSPISNKKWGEYSLAL